MKRFHATFILLATGTLLSCTSAPPPQRAALPVLVESPAPVIVQATPEPASLHSLRALAPDADPGVLALALAARSCARASGEAGAGDKLAVIDYSMPSTAKRLWVFDLARGELLYHEHVTHGQGSGDNYARRFSNIEGSFQTSLGLYRTAETYMGANGYSLRMDGLDRGYNDAARPRAIVIHGAWYAEPELIAKQGRLGRSQGCPALRQGIARQVIDTLKDEQLVFAYADDAGWLQGSGGFACGDGRSARQIIADARNHHGGGGMHVAVAAP